MMEGARYLFIDFEFTMPERNWKGFYPEIIEVGYILVEGGNIVDQFSSYVKPIKYPHLSKRCSSFLKISQQQVDTGITFKQMLDQFSKIPTVSSLKIVTWGNMDMKVLRNNCLHTELPFPFDGKEIDLSMEYKRFFGNQNQTGLWRAVQEYGKEGTGKHHKALDDALTTYQIFKLVEKDKRYLKKPKPATIGDVIDFSKLLKQHV
ncbi:MULTISPECIES: 3'-5' exonuclease KapD [Cytobacillus]|uniref:Or 3'-5' exonuclease KapD n=2 Tax=Cytobacillus TaxID=2675230 RepID=A0A248TJU3_9BACI|nr:or 3'-5' exonuclease KapD [Cytobacillus kochii]